MFGTFGLFTNNKEMLCLDSKAYHEVGLTSNKDEKTAITPTSNLICGCLKSFKCNGFSNENDKKLETNNDEKPILCECENNKLVKCKICLKLVQQSSFDSHTEKHKQTKNHICEVCGKAFFHPVHLRNHAATHETEKTHFCDICSKSFKSFKSLKCHRVYCEKEKIHYQCEECGESFSPKRAFFNHLRSHEKIPEESFNCEICCIEFDSSSSKKEHIMQVHVEAQRFVCDTCGEAFVTESAINRHNMTHIRKYPCHRCDSVFSKQRDLLAHRLQHSFFKRLKCRTCGKEYDPKAYADHKLKECSDRVENYCELCKKSLKGSKYAFKKHILTHTPLSERRIICEVCKKGFSDKTSLKKHIRLVHIAKRPYTCEFCSKSFSQLCKLKYHIVTHSNDRPVPCAICGKSFSSDKDVQIHMRVHTGEKPFKCSTCGKRFRQRGHVTSHQVVHTKQRPFTCTFCQKSFGLPSSLKKHLKLHTTNMTVTIK